MKAKVNCEYKIAGFPTGHTERMTLAGIAELMINGLEAPLTDFELFDEVAGWANDLFRHTLEEDGFALGVNNVHLTLDIHHVNYSD